MLVALLDPLVVGEVKMWSSASVRSSVVKYSGVLTSLERRGLNVSGDSDGVAIVGVVEGLRWSWMIVNKGCWW